MLKVLLRGIPDGAITALLELGRPEVGEAGEDAGGDDVAGDRAK